MTGVRHIRCLPVPDMCGADRLYLTPEALLYVRLFVGKGQTILIDLSNQSVWYRQQAKAFKRTDVAMAERAHLPALPLVRRYQECRFVQSFILWSFWRLKLTLLHARG